MKKRLLTVLLISGVIATCIVGCGQEEIIEEQVSENVIEESVSEDIVEEPVISDEEIAGDVAALIDALYEENVTDEQCQNARNAWDALTDEQKALCYGEYATPDYFGLDTGDASNDDSLNADDIGNNEVLIVSTGTSDNTVRVNEISSIEKYVADLYPSWAVRRAFTNEIEVNHILARDGEDIDTVTEALDRAVANGVKMLIIQPTFLYENEDYQNLKALVDTYSDSIDSIVMAGPVFGESGEVTTSADDNAMAIAAYITEDTAVALGYETYKGAIGDGYALCLVGTEDSEGAVAAYNKIQAALDAQSFISTKVGIDGSETASKEALIELLSSKGYRRIAFRALSLYDEDVSDWVSAFEEAGCFESVTVVGGGLFERDGLCSLLAEDVGRSMESMGYTRGAILADQDYIAELISDSDVFAVNEACNGKVLVEVKNGLMTFHISTVSQDITAVYTGSATDAANSVNASVSEDGTVANGTVVFATIDKVTAIDGTTSEVNGFTIPFVLVDKEFTLSIKDASDNWTEVTVTVANPR